MTARFLTDLKTVQALGSTTVVLSAPLVFDSDVLGYRVTVPAGFPTDFASVPRLPFAYLLFGGDVGDNAAATVHDFLYGLGTVPRATCDAVFREAMQAEGVAGWRRWPMWLGVRLFGRSHYGGAPAQPAPGT